MGGKEATCRGDEDKFFVVLVPEVDPMGYKCKGNWIEEQLKVWCQAKKDGGRV